MTTSIRKLAARRLWASFILCTGLHTVSAAICWSLSGKSREVLPLPRLRDSKRWWLP